MRAAPMRAIAQLIHAHVAPVGTFTVRRALPDRSRPSVGPWVFLDHFGPFRVKPGEDGVGPHPHAGIETVTYLLSGRNEHHDSAGHRGIVGPLGAQWMTAGRGIVHAEYPQPENEAEMTQHGIQLWTSLPRALKQCAPRYQRIDANAIPEVADGKVHVRVVAGRFGEHEGPAVVLMPTLLWHVRIDAGGTFQADIPAGFEVAAYVIAGQGAFSNALARVAAGSLAVYDDGSAPIVIGNAGGESLECMILGGAPAEGPLVFHGPFVTNSAEEARAAERAYLDGRMGSLPDHR